MKGLKGIAVLVLCGLISSEMIVHVQTAASTTAAPSTAGPTTKGASTTSAPTTKTPPTPKGTTGKGGPSGPTGSSGKSTTPKPGATSTTQNPFVAMKNEIQTMSTGCTPKPSGEKCDAQFKTYNDATVKEDKCSAFTKFEQCTNEKCTNAKEYKNTINVVSKYCNDSFLTRASVMVIASLVFISSFISGQL